jgi:beta-alanine degradation protein BauB
MQAHVRSAALEAPKVYHLDFENEQVRAYNVHFDPGEKAPMHAHPNHIIFPLNDGRMRITTANGKSQEMDIKANKAVWSNATAHTAENIGPNEINMFVVELKG